MIPVKSNMTGPTHEVSSKVYLSNANSVLRKGVLKPRPITTCNLIHKAAKFPDEKVDICKPTNNQSSALSPNVIRTSCLNIRKQSSPTSIGKPFYSVTKLSHLKSRKSAHRKLHHDRGFNTDIVLENQIIKSNHQIKSNYLWWKYHVNEFLLTYSYLFELLLLIIFLSINFDFVCKQFHFCTQPTLPCRVNIFLLVKVLADLSK